MKSNTFPKIPIRVRIFAKKANESIFVLIVTKFHIMVRKIRWNVLGPEWCHIYHNIPIANYTGTSTCTLHIKIISFTKHAGKLHCTFIGMYVLWHRLHGKKIRDWIFLSSVSEGKAMAKSYDCKFIETSAVLNHRVDELLVGTLSQIRLKEKQNSKRSKDGGCVPKAAKGLMKLLKKSSSGNMSKSCDNLYVLWSSAQIQNALEKHERDQVKLQVLYVHTVKALKPCACDKLRIDRLLNLVVLKICCMPIKLMTTQNRDMLCSQCPSIVCRNKTDDWWIAVNY